MTSVLACRLSQSDDGEGLITVEDSRPAGCRVTALIQYLQQSAAGHPGQARFARTPEDRKKLAPISGLI